MNYDAITEAKHWAKKIRDKWYLCEKMCIKLTLNSKLVKVSESDCLKCLTNPHEEAQYQLIGFVFNFQLVVFKFKLET